MEAIVEVLVVRVSAITSVFKRSTLSWNQLATNPRQQEAPSNLTLPLSFSHRQERIGIISPRYHRRLPSFLYARLFAHTHTFIRVLLRLIAKSEHIILSFFSIFLALLSLPFYAPLFCHRCFPFSPQSPSIYRTF